MKDCIINFFDYKLIYNLFRLVIIVFTWNMYNPNKLDILNIIKGHFVEEKLAFYIDFKLYRTLEHDLYRKCLNLKTFTY